MADVDAAERLAHRLLASELPRRWAHVRGVASRAGLVPLADSSEATLLVSAAWLHDIGYASPLVETGFHPIDGARHLRRLAADERVVNLVAHHSCARVEADLRGLAPVLASEFPRDDRLPHDELCFCDQTTSPDGKVVDVVDRLAEIRAPDGGVLRYSNWLRRVWWPACVAAGVGRMVEDDATGKVRYEGLGFHDLRRAAATGLVAEGVDVKTAQGLLGHSDSRLTLDHYAQVVTEQGEAAAKAMGRRFLRPAPRDERAMERP